MHGTRKSNREKVIKIGHFLTQAELSAKFPQDVSQSRLHTIILNLPNTPCKVTKTEPHLLQFTFQNQGCIGLHIMIQEYNSATQRFTFTDGLITIQGTIRSNLRKEIFSNPQIDLKRRGCGLIISEMVLNIRPKITKELEGESVGIGSECQIMKIKDWFQFDPKYLEEFSGSPSIEIGEKQEYVTLLNKLLWKHSLSSPKSIEEKATKFATPYPHSISGEGEVDEEEITGANIKMKEFPSSSVRLDAYTNQYVERKKKLDEDIAHAREECKEIDNTRLLLEEMLSGTKEQSETITSHEVLYEAQGKDSDLLEKLVKEGNFDRQFFLTNEIVLDKEIITPQNFQIDSNELELLCNIYEIPNAEGGAQKRGFGEAFGEENEQGEKRVKEE